MPKNQLFKSIPPRSVCVNVLNAFGLSGFDDTHNFSRSDLEAVDCVNKMSILKNVLTEYYLPCKKKIYLRDINYKRSITILRQCIKIYNFVLKSKEKYIKGDKLIIYQIVPLDEKPKEKKEISNCIISFD